MTDTVRAIEWAGDSAAVRDWPPTAWAGHQEEVGLWVWDGRSGSR